MKICIYTAVESLNHFFLKCFIFVSLFWGCLKMKGKIIKETSCCFCERIFFLFWWIESHKRQIRGFPLFFLSLKYILKVASPLQIPIAAWKVPFQFQSLELTRNTHTHTHSISFTHTHLHTHAHTLTVLSFFSFWSVNQMIFFLKEKFLLFNLQTNNSWMVWFFGSF